MLSATHPAQSYFTIAGAMASARYLNARSAMRGRDISIMLRA
jgi:hypothetical protein